MYGNVDHVAQLEAEGRKVADIETPLNVVKKIRELAARLQQTLRVVPAYSILAKLRIVPATDDMILLIRELTTWSNSIYQGDPAPHRDAIADPSSQAPRRPAATP